MYIITTSLYPNDKAKEVADMYLKCMTKYPDDASVSTPVVPAAVQPTFEGIKVITVNDVKKGKLEDARAIASNRLSMFFDIQGFRYTIQTYANLEEALKLIGM